MPTLEEQVEALLASADPFAVPAELGDEIPGSWEWGDAFAVTMDDLSAFLEGSVWTVRDPRSPRATLGAVTFVKLDGAEEWKASELLVHLRHAQGVDRNLTLGAFARTHRLIKLRKDTTL
jgi:hypothetical protein